MKTITCVRGSAAMAFPEALNESGLLLTNAAGLTEDGMTESAWYQENRILLVMNNTPDSLETEVRFPLGALTVSLNPFEMKFVPV